MNINTTLHDRQCSNCDCCNLKPLPIIPKVFWKKVIGLAGQYDKINRTEINRKRKVSTKFTTKVSQNHVNL